MDRLTNYVQKTIGNAVQEMELRKQDLDRLPFHIRQAYFLRRIGVLGRDIVIAEPTKEPPPTIGQIEKQFRSMREALGAPVALMTKEITSVTRKRLIEKAIDFIVPGKQLYLPTLLTDLQESFPEKTTQRARILPSSQVILLYKILNRNDRIEQYTFKQLANRLQYSPMAVTKAVTNLEYHKLCEVTGIKEKHLEFHATVPDLWRRALPLLVTPVLTQVYVDERPPNTNLLKSNLSALSEYSEVSEGRQEYYAIEKGLFHVLRKSKQLLNANDHEGPCCLEVWKYDPAILPNRFERRTNVDPLSLYLSMRNISDERIALALDAIIKDYIW